jgi:hypothetical protein
VAPFRARSQAIKKDLRNPGESNAAGIVCSRAVREPALARLEPLDVQLEEAVAPRFVEERAHRSFLFVDCGRCRGSGQKADEGRRVGNGRDQPRAVDRLEQVFDRSSLVAVSRIEALRAP